MSRAQVNENAGEQYGNTSPPRPQPAVLQNPYCKVKQLYLKRWGFFSWPFLIGCFIKSSLLYFLETFLLHLNLFMARTICSRANAIVQPNELSFVLPPAPFPPPVRTKCYPEIERCISGSQPRGEKSTSRVTKRLLPADSFYNHSKAPQKLSPCSHGDVNFAASKYSCSVFSLSCNCH